MESQCPPLSKPQTTNSFIISTTGIPNVTTAAGSLINSVSAVTSPNVVTIPIPVISSDNIYTYVAVKGSVHDQNCVIFGLNQIEHAAFLKLTQNGTTTQINGTMVNKSPIDAINLLSQLGYKVICCSGEAEIVWTMEREI